MKNKFFTCLAACTFALSSALAAPAKGSASSKSASSASRTNVWPIIATVACIGLGVAALVSISNTQGTHSH